MKFDITRAWKDENYRQSLSEEELSTLPANPAGELELNETELDTVAGGSCGPVGFFEHQNSVALICEINVNSINVGNIAILGAVTNVCTTTN
jgi:mersacidin/lichenicidin family type 2 lantibiotic